MKRWKKILVVILILTNILGLSNIVVWGSTKTYETMTNAYKYITNKSLNNLLNNNVYARIGLNKSTSIQKFLEVVYNNALLAEKNKVEIEEVTNVSGESEVKADYDEIFKNDIFIGDSITSGMSCYGILKEDLIITKTGMHVYEALDKVDTIVNRKPENIYIHLGINDIDKSFTSEIYGGYYLELVKQLKKRLPNSNIYIQSILPVLPKATKAKSVLNNEYIQEYNNQLIKIAEKEKVHFLNISEVLEGESDSIYAKDGIHFKESFYNKWLDYIIKNIK
jgi:hypothetical protein